jgi:hypothetical protein
MKRRCIECHAIYDSDPRAKYAPGKKNHPYFCPECDAQRITRIDRQFREISDMFDRSNGEAKP